MHTRRLASFFLGAWLLGILMVSFVVATQNFAQVDRILNSPPAAIARDIDELGQDLTRQLLRYQAAETNRFLFSVWGIMQTGLALAFAACVVMTAHRSKLLIIGGVLLLVVVLIQTFYLIPTMTALGRAFDFLPPGANSAERDLHRTYHAWSSMLEIVKFGVGLILAGRLMLDFYAWRDRVSGTDTGSGRRRRRRKRRTRDGSDVVDQVQPVDHSEDSHIDR